MTRRLRITGGSLAGRRIECPPGKIRPAMDRMRESLFSILGNLDATSFLDLFSGSGVMALEAVSRGAVRGVCVERDWRKKEVALRNVGLAGGTIELVISPVEGYLRTGSEKFDYVFLDPPFAYHDKSRLLRRLSESGAIIAGGVVIIHHPGDELEPPPELRCYDTRRYGGSHLWFYQFANDR